MGCELTRAPVPAGVVCFAAASKRARRGVGPSSSTAPEREVIVAVKQSNILATAFHPELTEDLTWHSYFMSLVSKTTAITAK